MAARVGVGEYTLIPPPDGGVQPEVIVPMSLFQRALRGSAALAFVLAACNPGDGSVTGTGPPLPNPKIAITTPGQVAIVQGQSAVAAVTIARTDYTGVVFMTLSGLPTGVTGPSVTSTQTNQINITLVADTNATLGTRTVTVNASGVEVASVTGTFQLTVVAK